VRLSVLLVPGITLMLVGCIAEEDKASVTNEQGEPVSDPTLTLNGFWDGQINQTTDIRMLIYNGNVYARDSSNGYYGTTLLNNSTRWSSMALNATGITAADDTAKAYAAEGSDLNYDLSLLLTSLFSSNDSLQGNLLIDGSTPGFVSVTRDGTWNNNARLSKLVKTGAWTAGDYQMVTNTAAGGVSFQGDATSTPGCTFSGLLTELETSHNLYGVSLTERSNCVAFNDMPASGYAGFNSDGDLEFYLRSDDSGSLLFMTFTPPAGTTTTTTTDTTTDTTVP